MKKKLTIGGLLAAAAIVALAGGLFSSTNGATSAIPSASAAMKAPFYYGVWLPYWQSQNGAQNVAQNLDELDEVSPFSYEIGNGGTLIDDLNIGNGSWNPWFSAVSELGIKIIPTIADFDGNGIYNMLSNTATRQALENRVAALVKTENFSGIDIDFESMTENTRPYYSLFIEGLAERLHPAGKVLTCSVIARTPPQDLYTVITPDDTVYPENYTVLNQYCDEVRIEAYDEDTEDLTLDGTKGNGQLYAPVTDPAWVKQVLSVTLPYINPKKIMLGVPTYGYEYEVSWNDGITTYQRVRAFDYLDAMDRADSVGIEPTRNSADELSFIYTSSTYIQVSPILSTDVDSPIEPAALTIPPPANATTTFYITFPDSTSILDEINLAKADGLRGVMLFKADGDIDPLTWQYMN
jgi:spore germination protein YaaH